MSRHKLYFMDSDDDVKMGPLTGELPKKIIVWRLNFRERNDEFQLHYDNVAEHELPAANESELKKYLEKIFDGSEPQWKPVHGQETGESTLSINHLDRTIMIFVMRSDRKWEFSSGQYPFTVKRGRDSYYMMAKAAMRTAAGVDLVDEPGEGCRIALFVADAAADFRDNAVDGGFRTPFNIFVDLLLHSTDGRPPRRMPIAIDPDVGHPGGSFPPP